MTSRVEKGKVACGWFGVVFFDQSMRGSGSCAAGGESREEGGMETGPREGQSRVTGMRIIQPRLSWENNYASDLC